MKRIICHWTAGTYTVGDTDRQHYHRIYAGNGNCVLGVHDIENNSAAARAKGMPYAAHTLDCNTDSIGLSLACMYKAVEGKDNGPYPMTEIQFEAMCKDAATLCHQYNIPISRTTVLSHAEVQATLGIKQRGKWDYTVLPFKPELKGATACGDYLRKRVYAHYNELYKKQVAPLVVQEVKQEPKKTTTLASWFKSLFGAKA